MQRQRCLEEGVCVCIRGSAPLSGSRMQGKYMNCIANRPHSSPTKPPHPTFSAFSASCSFFRVSAVRCSMSDLL
jgi:hypothetical protein